MPYLDIVKYLEELCQDSTEDFYIITPSFLFLHYFLVDSLYSESLEGTLFWY